MTMKYIYPPSIKGTNTIADYANPSVDPFYLKAQGYEAVVRYINGGLAKGQPHWKIITRTERDRILRAGLGILLVFEKDAARWRRGYAAGVVDGREASADAKMFGYTGIILVAFDQDITPKDKPVVLEYWRGFLDGNTTNFSGAYGDYDLFEMLGPLGNCGLYWQANAPAWSWAWVKDRFVKRIHPRAHVVQKYGKNIPSGRIDPNEVLKKVATWFGPDPVPAPIPVPVPPLVVVPEPLQPTTPLPPPATPRQPGPLPTIPTPTLQRGSVGGDVKLLQQIMTFWKWYGKEIDGIFGIETDASTRWMQAILSQSSTVELKVDGIYGPKTAVALRDFLVAMRDLAAAK